MAKGTVLTRSTPQVQRMVSNRVRGGTSPDRAEAFAADYIKAHNETWAIVGYCPVEGCRQSKDSPNPSAPEGEPRGLLASELVSHHMRHVNGRIRHLARMIQDLSPELRRELLSLYEDGELKGPLVEPL